MLCILCVCEMLSSVHHTYTPKSPAGHFHISLTSWIFRFTTPWISYVTAHVSRTVCFVHITDCFVKCVLRKVAFPILSLQYQKLIGENTINSRQSISIIKYIYIFYDKSFAFSLTEGQTNKPNNH